VRTVPQTRQNTHSAHFGGFDEAKKHAVCNQNGVLIDQTIDG
jgi:hypothetical protein